MKGKDLFLYWCILVLTRVLSLIPRHWMQKAGNVIGRIWFLIDPRHVDIAASNMAHAFGMSPKDKKIRAMVKKNFMHLAGLACELPSLVRMNEKNLSSYARFDGVENITKEQADNHGVILLTGHYGNWELMALALALYLKNPIHILVRPLDVSAADKVLTDVRSRTGNVIMDKDKSASLVSDLLRKNAVVGILLDQNASDYEGVYVPFFGRIACTNKGAALFALRYKASVIPLFSVREPDGRYRIQFKEPLKLVRTGNIKKDVETNTALFNDIIERQICENPYQWLWVHRRWRVKAPQAVVEKKLSPEYRKMPIEYANKK